MFSRRRARTIGCLATLVISFALSAPISVYAQVVGATLSGTVTDTSGAVIPNAQMIIKNVGTAVTRNATTDAAGFYTAPNLAPGSYSVMVTAPGFKTEVRSGITLTVGAEQTLNISMDVGQVSQTVSVTAEAPNIQLASSTIGNVVNSTTVVELPLNGRDWTSLAALEPGVNTVQTQVTGAFSGGRAPRGYGAQLTISGTRPQQNNYRLDGITISDFVGGSPGSVVNGITLGVDAVGEFSVLTSNASAEYGRGSGGVINAVTRAGTNQFHGDAYWFLRDEGLDSRGFFDAAALPPFHRNQFGASFGGPIQKDKTFFFVNYEGLRQILGVTAVDNVPSPNARNGIIAGGGAPVSSCPAGTTLFVPGQSNLCVDNQVIPYLPLFPLPNAGLIGAGNTGHFNVVASQNARENFVTNRIDRTFSGKDSVSGTWLLDRATVAQPDPFDNVLNGQTYQRVLVTAEETHLFSSSLINTFRIGYSRTHDVQNDPLSAINPIADNTSLGVVPTQFCLTPSHGGCPPPQVNVAGLSSFLALGGFNLNVQFWNSYQLYDDVFVTKGAHSVKFGFVSELMRHNPHNRGQSNGVFSFGGLTNFLTNKPNSLIANVGPPHFLDFSQWLFGGYFQDDWRVRPNLTLNLGLRYEAVTDLSEAHNLLSNLRNITDVAPTLGGPLIQNPTLHNFEPRIGFAWDPFHNAKTSVRGAFGMFDILPTSSEFFSTQQSAGPFVKLLNVSPLPAGSFPTAIEGFLATGGPLSQLRFAQDQFNPSRNYVMIWNLNIQRELTPSTTLTVGYVGNHGVHMIEQMDDGNVVPPVAFVNGLPLWPIPVGSGTKPSPSGGNLGLVRWAGSALYDALDVTLQKKFSHGFQAEGSYNWGKNIDDGSATTVADPYQNSVVSPFLFCVRKCVRGLADFNIAQNFTLNYIWDVPTPNSWSGVASRVLGGWEVGGILAAHTGVPITPLIGGDPLGENNGSPNDFPDRLRGPGCGSVVNPGNVNNYIKLNCFALPVATSAIAAECQPFAAVPGTCANLDGNAGRNSIIGPGFWNFDFSLFKNNRIPKISESFNVQFRAEFFNIFNHSTFQTPVDNNTLFNQDGTPTGGAGSLDALVGRPREIQFGLKIIF